MNLIQQFATLTVVQHGGLSMWLTDDDLGELFDEKGDLRAEVWEIVGRGMEGWLMGHVRWDWSRRLSSDDLEIACHDGLVDGMRWLMNQSPRPGSSSLLNYALAATRHRLVRMCKGPRLGWVGAPRIEVFPDSNSADSAESIELDDEVRVFEKSLASIDLYIFKALYQGRHDLAKVAAKFGVSLRTAERRRASLRERLRHWLGIRKKEKDLWRKTPKNDP